MTPERETMERADRAVREARGRLGAACDAAREAAVREIEEEARLPVRPPLTFLEAMDAVRVARGRVVALTFAARQAAHANHLALWHPGCDCEKTRKQE